MADILLKTPLRDILQGQQLITLKESDTVKDALITLSKNRISSAPVIQANGSVLKSIDMLDLVSYVSIKFQTTTKAPQQQVEEFLNKPLRNIIDISNRNPWQVLPASKSLRRAIQLLQQPKLHRIWVEENGKLIGVISQSKVIDILLQKRDSFPEIMHMKLNELFPESRQTKAIFYKSSLLDAFQKIYNDKVSGLAVVDENFRIIGNISASDLKLGDFSNPMSFFNELQMPIHEFLSSKQGQKQWAMGKKGGFFQPITITPFDTLRNAMEMCSQYEIHRIYVVDELQRPQYVLGLSDIIGQFSLYPLPVGTYRG